MSRWYGCSRTGAECSGSVECVAGDPQAYLADILGRIAREASGEETAGQVRAVMLRAMEKVALAGGVVVCTDDRIWTA